MAVRRLPGLASSRPACSLWPHRGFVPVLLGFSVVVRRVVHFVGNGGLRREPVVAILFDFPRFWLAAFKACVGTRVGRTAEADLVPGPGVRVIGIDGIAHQLLPEPVYGHLLPDRSEEHTSE